jgi:carbon-monoxide dehydrogenase large subunit
VMDAVAAHAGLNRAEVRRRNLLTSDELPYVSVTNQRYDSGDYPRALTMALEAIGYDAFAAEQAAARRDGRLIGLGLACYVEYTGVNSKVFGGRGMRAIPGFDSAHVRLDEEGRAVLWTTLPSAGQGVGTTFAQIAADALRLPFEAVTVARADTAVGGLRGTGTFASRSAMAGGGAIDAASGEILQRLRDDAADALEIAPEDLVVADGRISVRGAPAHGLSFGELVRRAPEARYRVSASFDPPAVTYPYGTHACRVEIDPDTGRVIVDRYVVVDDCGRVINPLIVAGQIHGAVAQGLAGALYETLAYDEDGQLQTSSLLDYLVPTAVEIPRMELNHLEIPAPESPNGTKGVGEGGTLAPGAAVANAVGDALRVECNALPVRPEWVRRAAQAVLVVPQQMGV